MRTGPTRLGPYELVETLGQGAMGAVYKGRHVQLGVERAVKVLIGQQTPARVERFLRETRHLAQVRHPNVVGVHDVGQAESGHLFYAMDLVEGKDLAHVLAGGPLGYSRALDVTIGVCRGVGALHEAGILHRDVKPANVVLRPGGEPVVLDLGLAVAPELDQRITKTGALLGTPHYMAPEQARGQLASAQSDVYALGLIAHEVLSGYRITESGQLPGFVRLPAPSSVDSDLPRAFDAICARALADAPEDRYATAGELAQALEGLREAPGVTRRTIRRVQLAAVCLLALGGAAGVAASTPQVESEAPPPALPVQRVTPEDAVTRAAAERDAARALRRAIRLEPFAARLAALTGWIEEHPGHPLVEVAKVYRRDARLRAPLQAWPLSGEFGFQTAAFLRDGSLISVAHDQPPVRWSQTSGEELKRWPELGKVRALAPSPTADRFALGVSRNGVLLVTLGAPDRFESLGEGTIYQVAFSPDGRALAYASSWAIFWVDLEGDRTPQQLKTLTPKEGDSPIEAMAFSPDGKALVVGGDKGLGILAFDMPAGRLLYRSPQLSKCHALVFLRDSKQFVAARGGGTIGLHSLDSPMQVALYGEASVVGTSQRSARALAVTPDGEHLHSLVKVDRSRSDGPGERQIWDAHTRELLATIAHKTATGADMSISPDGTRLIVSAGDRAELWEVGIPPALPSLDD